MFLVKRNLNDTKKVACFVSSDKLFHARIVAEKRVIKQVRISVNSLDVV